MAIQHENMEDNTQALLFYQIAEDLYEKHKDKFDLTIDYIIDEFYKLGLLKKIKNKKFDNSDKLGLYFMNK